MSNSDTAYLEALKIARDAIVAGLSEGRTTITYQIRGRLHTVENPTLALRNLDKLITEVEQRIQRASYSPFRLAKVKRAKL